MTSPKICKAIAAFTIAHDQTDSILRQQVGNSALQLARTSVAFRTAVLSSLSYRFGSRSRCGILKINSACSLQLFFADVLEVDVTGFVVVEPLYLSSLLKAPKLRRAIITDHPGFLEAIDYSHSVCELHVSIQRESSFASTFEAIATLRLTRLKIICAVHFEDCPCNDDAYFSFGTNVIAKACRSLEWLQIDCNCDTEDDEGDHVSWRSMPQIPTLRGLSFYFCGTVTAEAMSILQAMSSVTVGYGPCPQPYLLAIELGTSVTERVTGQMLEADQILALSRRTRLSRLEALFFEGAERDLPALVQALPSLRALCIGWGNLQIEQQSMPSLSPA